MRRTAPWRLVEAVRADGRQAEIARCYTELGVHIHDGNEEFNEGAMLDASEVSGAFEWASAMDDPLWDAAVEASHDAAMRAAGPAIGSAVLELAGSPQGLHGPIFAEMPRRDDALRIWEAVVTLMTTPQFLEIGRGRL